MRLRSFSPQAALAFVALTFYSLAQGELPNLQPAQVLYPSTEDYPSNWELPDPAFGGDVEIRGNLAVVGIPPRVTMDGIGRAAIFVRDAEGVWSRQATLTPRDLKPIADFGRAVALSGRRALVGSSTDVYVFERDGNAWRQQQKLAFGEPVGVSDIDFQGRLAVVGVAGAPGFNQGAYVFYLGTRRRLRSIARILPSDVQPTDRFGVRVALSGSTVAITAPGYNRYQGAVYVFTCSDTGCRQQQKLLANDGEPLDSFGWSVDVLGNTLVVGALTADTVYGDDFQPPSEENFTAQGTGYVFVRSSAGGEWGEVQKLHITPQENNWYINFGESVALSANHIVIGAPYGFRRFDPGKVFVYTRTGGRYVATHGIINTPSLGDSVSISGGTVFTGAPQENGGEAHIYAIQP